MKIAYLANLKFPNTRAHSVQIAHTCKAFFENKVDVTLFVNSRQPVTKEEMEEFFGFKIPYLVVYVPLRFFHPTIKITFYIGELLFALLFLRHHNWRDYDCLYSRGEWLLFFLSFFVDSKRMVWESHEAKYTLPARYLLKRGVRCVVISEGIQDFYRKKNVPRAQLCIAHDAVDDSFFEILPDKKTVREKLGLPPDQRIAMYIGGLDAWKGVDIFMAASEHASDLQFVVIGGSAEEIAKHQATYPRVKFLGFLPYKELPANQQAADMLVVPNTDQNDLSAKYTSPLKLFAHLTSGVPLVLSDVSSLRVVVGDEGTYFTPGDASSLAKVLQAVDAAYEKSVEVAKQLQTKAREYTWQKRAETIVNFIQHEQK